MNLRDYFESTSGIGILATADGNGKSNAAVYARPHLMDDGSIAFIMLERLSHSNLSANPQAAYLFVEKGSKSKGIRLYLTKIHEEKNTELLYKLRKVKYEDDEDQPRYLVFFRIDKVRPLVGSDERSLPFDE